MSMQQAAPQAVVGAALLSIDIAVSYRLIFIVRFAPPLSDNTRHTFQSLRYGVLRVVLTLAQSHSFVAPVIATPAGLLHCVFLCLVPLRRFLHCCTC